MPHNVHNNVQTAFRLPERLLMWLRKQAEHEGDTVTMTGIVVRALEAERERTANHVVNHTPIVAAEGEQPQPTGKNCKHPNFRGVKGVCPDCQQIVGYK